MISVHSAKFPSEKITANIRKAVMRHGIHHPVINDADFEVWNQYAVRAWPTVVLIDPAGKVVGQQSGEITAEGFAPVIQAMINDFTAQGSLDRTPIAGILDESTLEIPRLLDYPAKLCYAEGGRLFVADTGHHRLLEIQLSEDGLSGEVVRIFGSGEAGLKDGSIYEAQFHDPHGMAFVQSARGSTLYVADTENHAIRAIDLVNEQVRTIAGNGALGRGQRANESEPTTIALRSPWALAARDQLLLIAMAGSHQIWVLIDERQIAVFAGNGVEALVDGPRSQASFNQPSDLVLDMGHLFVADSEASAIRAISLNDNPQVFTLVGQGLFEFGDVDGKGAVVRLQHPTGLASHASLLYIADSYNHKIKTLDPATGTMKTLLGSGKAGTNDGPFATAELYEPEGVVLGEGKLYIADTNNHLIRVANIADKSVATLNIKPL
ncbi:MAG: alkyl hydroperoxide reductase [Caldilineaceae bacterium]